MNANNHRRVYVLDADSAEQALTQIAQDFSPSEVESGEPSITVIDMTRDFNQNQWLGQELGDTLIYFGDKSKINGLLAVWGCVKGGQRLFLACQHSRLSDYFKRQILLPRLQALSEAQGNQEAAINLVGADPCVCPWSEKPMSVLFQYHLNDDLTQKLSPAKGEHMGSPLQKKSAMFLELISIPKNNLSKQANTAPVAEQATNDLIASLSKRGKCSPTVVSNAENHQQPAGVEFNALEKLHRATGIVHLIGERGSGKSTLLGHFLQAVLVEPEPAGRENIVLTSPLPAASKNSLKVIEQSKVSRETLTYCAPANFLKALQSATLGVIDEAATLPKSLLTAAIDHATGHGKKLILSTTIEGYEGTGQSYRLNYLAGSSAEAGDNVIRLGSPKRFSADDPLYCLCQSLYRPTTYIAISEGDLCCSSEIVHKLSTGQARYHYLVLDQRALRERGWTPACFALLREAHYKTTPNDLARFYSDEAIFCLCIEGDELVAAAYGLPEKLPADVDGLSILYGTRRARNALTQQSLIHAYAELVVGKTGDNPVDNAVSASVDNFALLGSRALRISRIATAASHRRRGLASQLLTQLSTMLSEQGYDFISTSFSGSAVNLAFWQAQQLTPARIGLYPNKANNEYAVLMLKGLNPTAERLAKRCHTLCARHIRYFSTRYLPHYQCLIDNAPALVDNDDNLGDKSRAEQLKQNLVSVLEHHRDKDWLLPALTPQQRVDLGF